MVTEGSNVGLARTSSGRLQGKVAFVTGAGRGQGRSHAVHLAREGADIIAVDVCAPVETVNYPMSSPEDLEETARQVKELDRRAVIRTADVRDLDGLAAALDAGVQELGGLDIVCANAGIGGVGRTEEMSMQVWQEMIDINLTGVWLTAKVAIPHLRKRGAGSIVMTSSATAVRGFPNIAHYTAAKAGILGICRSLAHELAEHGIRVNVVMPTSVDTPLIQNLETYKMFAPDIEEPTREDVAPRFAAITALQVPWLEPADVSRLVTFLASDDARYVTGSVMRVDAGTTA